MNKQYVHPQPPQYCRTKGCDCNNQPPPLTAATPTQQNEATGLHDWVQIHFPQLQIGEGGLLDPVWAAGITEAGAYLYVKPNPEQQSARLLIQIPYFVSQEKALEIAFSAGVIAGVNRSKMIGQVSQTEHRYHTAIVFTLSYVDQQSQRLDAGLVEGSSTEHGSLPLERGTSQRSNGHDS